MSGAVDTKTVEMRFDNSNFEKNARESVSTLEKLKAALKLDGASRGLEEVEKASKKLDFKDLNNNIDNIGKHFSAMEVLATGALLKIGSKAGELGLQIANALTLKYPKMGWDKYAQKTEAVQTIMANLKDTQGKFTDESAKMNYVNHYLEKLMWFSDETSYSFTEMTSNLGKFVAVGQDLDTSVTAIQGIATWAAMAGQRSEGAARAMYNISQALGVGAMTTIDWKSIENANMATAEFKETAIAAAVAMGKLEKGQVTVESFRESLREKWFDKEVMMSVFKTYGEAADRIQQYATLHNTNVYDAIRALEKEDASFSKTLGFRAFKAAQEAKTFGEVVDATADAVSTKWLRIFENIFGNYQQAKELWSGLAEDLYQILAEPLDVLNQIMTRWNKGFFSDGPKNLIEKWFESGDLDDLNSEFGYVTQEMADLAVATDEATYKIVKMADGTKRLYRTIKDDKGRIKKQWKEIFEPEKGRELVSGRENFLTAFQNIFDVLVKDIYDEHDNLEQMSFFGALKRGLQEVFLGTSDVDEIVPLVSRKIWEMTLAFKALTERLKPSMETSLKIKNVFKGLFTVFKMAGKFVAAVFKPFKELFSRIFSRGENEKSILDIADAMGTWIQKLDEFLDENKVFETVSSKVKAGLDLIEQGLNNVSMALTGMNIRQLVSFLKDQLFAFFTDYDFKGLFAKITGFFSSVFTKVSEAANTIAKTLTGKSIGELWTNLFDKIKNFDYAGIFDKVVGFFVSTITQLKQVKTGDLPKKLTPLQKFAVAVQNVFRAIVGFFSNIGPNLVAIGSTIKNAITSIVDVFTGKKSLDKVVENRPVLEGLVGMFSGVVDFFRSVGPMLGKIGKFIGGFISTLGKSIAEWAKDKDPVEIISAIIKGGFFVSLTGFLTSISKLAKGLSGGITAVKKVLKAYSREINASALLDIALAIGIMTLALYGLSKIENMDNVAKGLTAIAVALGALMVVKELLGVFKQWASLKISGGGDSGGKDGGPLSNLKDMLTNVIGQSIFANDATAKFVKIALGILLAAAAALLIVKAVERMGGAIQSIAKIPEEEIKAGGQRVGQIVALFGVFAFLSGWSTNASSALFAALGALVLVKAIGNLIDLLADLGGNSAKMDNIKKVGEEFKGVFDSLKTVAKWVVSIAALLAIVQVVIAAMSRGKGGNSKGAAAALKQFGKNYMRIAVSMLIFAGAIALMGYVASTLPAGSSITSILYVFKTLVLIIGILTAVVAFFASESSEKVDISGTLKQFGKVFTRIAIALALLTASFWLFSKIKFENTPVDTIKWIFLVFVGLVAALTVLAWRIAAAEGDVSKNFAKNIAAIAALFVAIALSLALLTGVFYLFSQIKFDNMNASVWTISTIFLVFTALMIALAGIAGAIAAAEGDVSKNFAKNIATIAGLFLAVAFSLMMVAQAFSIFAEIKFGEGGASLGQIAGIFAVFIGLVGLIGILGGTLIKDTKGLVAIGLIAVLMIATAYSLQIVAQAFSMLANSVSKEDMLVCTQVLIAFAGAIAVLALIGGLLSGLTEGIGALGILAIAGLVLALGYSLQVAAVGLSIGANAIANFMKVVSQYGPAFNAAFDQFSTILAKGLYQILSAIVPFVGSGALLALGLLMVAFGVACLLAGVGIAALVTPLAELMKAIVQFIEVISDKGPKFVENFDKVVNSFLDTVIAAAPKMKTAVKAIITAFIEGVAENIGNIAATASLMPLAIVVGFLEGLARDFPEMVTKLEESLNTITDTIDKLYDVFLAAGEKIILHFVAGMLGSLGEIPAIFDTIGDYAKDWAKNGGKATKSIDYYAEKNGLKYAQGFAAGIEKGKDGVVDAEKGVVESDASTWTDAYIRARAKYAADLAAKGAKRANTAFTESDYESYYAREVDKLTAERDKAITDKAEKAKPTEVPVEVEPKVKPAPDAKTTTANGVDKLLGSIDLGALASKAFGINIPVGFDFSEIGGAEKLAGLLPDDVKIPAGLDLSKMSGSDLLTNLMGSGALGNIDLSQFGDLGGQAGEAFTGALAGKGTVGMAKVFSIDKDAVIQNGTEVLNEMSDMYEGADFTGSVASASQEVADVIPGPVQSLDSSTWGADIGSGLASGMLSKIPAVSAAASTLASVIHDILGFSEPKTGPLSDFHTYAPDMIKLWCSGVRNNLGEVKASTNDVATTMSDGMSTALDYVSGLIDNGMSDELTIRPVMDLSEIQNGANTMADMLSNDQYAVTGTARLAASTAAGMNQTAAMRTPERMTDVDVEGSTNTFYITSNNADEVADKVSKILGAQTRRKKAVWTRAHK